MSDEKQKFITLGDGEDRHVVPVGADGKLQGTPPPHIVALIHAGTRDPAKKAAWAEKLEKPGADHSVHREAVLKHLESSKTAAAHEADIGGKKVKLTPGEMRLTQAAGVHARPWVASSEGVPDVHVRESFTREQGSRSGRGATNWMLQERAPEEPQEPVADSRVTSAVEAESGVKFGRRSVARAEEQLAARKADAEKTAATLANVKGTHLESGHKHPHKTALAMVNAAAKELDDERAKLEDTLKAKTRMHAAIVRGKDRGAEVVRQAREIKDPAAREKFLRDAREKSGSSGVEEAVDAELAQSAPNETSATERTKAYHASLDDRAKAMQGTKATVDLHPGTARAGQSLSTPAEVYEKYFAVHKTSPKSDEWQVTHVPTGMNAARVPTKHHALKTIAAIQHSGLDWSRADLDKHLPEEASGATQDAIDAVRFDGHPDEYAADRKARDARTAEIRAGLSPEYAQKLARELGEDGMPAPGALASSQFKELQELAETIQDRGERHGPSTAQDVAESNAYAVDDALADIHRDARRQGADPHVFTAHHLGEHGPVLAKHYPDKFPGIAPASDSAPVSKPPAPINHNVGSMDASKLDTHHKELLEEQRKLTQHERLGTAKASDRDRQAQLVHEIADAGGEKHRRAKEAVQTAERTAHAKETQEKQRWGSLSEAERQAIVRAGGTRSDWRTREQRRHDDHASYVSKELERQQARMGRTKDPESRAEYAPGLEQARQDVQSHLSKPRPEAQVEIHAAQQRHPGSVPDHEAALRAMREKHGAPNAPDDWHTFAAKHPDVAGQISDVLQGHPQRKAQMSLMARAHQKHGEEQKGWDNLVARTPFEHKTFRAPTTTKSAIDLHGDTYGGLVAHKDDAGDWAVSHLGSGLRLNQAPLESEQAAKRGLLAAHGLAARDAQSSVDWTKPDVTKEPGFKRVAQDIEASVHAPSNWAHYAANEGLHWGNRGGAASVLKSSQADATDTARDLQKGGDMLDQELEKGDDSKPKFITLGEGESRRVVPLGADGKLHGDPPPHIMRKIHDNTTDPEKKAAWAEKLKGGSGLAKMREIVHGPAATPAHHRTFDENWHAERSRIREEYPDMDAEDEHRARGYEDEKHQARIAEAAERGERIPNPVLDDMAARLGRDDMMRNFRGKSEAGIQGWVPPDQRTAAEYQEPSFLNSNEAEPVDWDNTSLPALSGQRLQFPDGSEHEVVPTKGISHFKVGPLEGDRITLRKQLQDMGGVKLAPDAESATSLRTDPRNYTPERLAHVFWDVKREIERHDRSLSPLRAGELAAVRVVGHLNRERKRVENAVRSGQSVSHADRALYDRLTKNDGQQFLRQLVDISGSRTMLMDREHEMAQRLMDAPRLEDNALAEEHRMEKLRARNVTARQRAGQPVPDHAWTLQGPVDDEETLPHGHGFIHSGESVTPVLQLPSGHHYQGSSVHQEEVAGVPHAQWEHKLLESAQRAATQRGTYSSGPVTDDASVRQLHQSLEPWRKRKTSSDTNLEMENDLAARKQEWEKVRGSDALTKAKEEWVAAHKHDPELQYVHKYKGSGMYAERVRLSPEEAAEDAYADLHKRANDVGFTVHRPKPDAHAGYVYHNDLKRYMKDAHKSVKFEKTQHKFSDGTTMPAHAIGDLRAAPYQTVGGEQKWGVFPAKASTAYDDILEGNREHGLAFGLTEQHAKSTAAILHKSGERDPRVAHDVANHVAGRDSIAFPSDKRWSDQEKTYQAISRAARESGVPHAPTEPADTRGYHEMTPEEYVSHKRDVSQRAHEHQIRRAEAGELHGGDWTEHRPYKSRADALRQLRPEMPDEKDLRREHMQHVNRARVQGRPLRPEVARAYGL